MEDERGVLPARGHVTFDGAPSELKNDAVLAGYFGVDIDRRREVSQ